jgi:hypothetical protein
LTGDEQVTCCPRSRCVHESPWNCFCCRL